MAERLQYIVRGVLQSGEQKEMRVTAESDADAAIQVREQGLYPEAVTRAFQASGAVPPPRPQRPPGRPMKRWGWTLALLGAAVAFYFLFGYDTTVATPGGFGPDRVHNTGLLQIRMLSAGWLTIPQAAAAVGVSAETMPSLCHRREIRHIRTGTTGRAIRIRPDSCSGHSGAKAKHGW